MFPYAWVQFLVISALILVLIPILGKYMANVFTGNCYYAELLFGWLERFCYRIASIIPHKQMHWKDYTKALLLFNLFGCITLFFIQLTQYFLPLNPQGFPAPSIDSIFNTTISFVTNTNWQSYAGETTLSYFSQMAGLTAQNFLSAATGMAVLLALIRGITKKSVDTIGNFWVDLVRTIVYILLPLAIALALILVEEGVIQTLTPYTDITTLEHAKQTIPLGPVASQVAIKQLGTNGGGFFNANSAHPFENPTGLSNLLQTLAILLIPAASVYMYGIMIGSKKHAWLLLSVMFIMWVAGIAVSIYSEHLHNPIVDATPYLEGKETRFGITKSLIWSVSTTGTSNGSVNAMMSSLSPLAGGVALFNIMVGELIFGGVGVGLCSMLMYVLLTVFLSGLMVGRSPEYLGKKIEKREMQWVMVAVLVPGALILIGTSLSCLLPTVLANLGNQGPHGLTEILYAFSSAAGNNGSAFAGLNANTSYFNYSLGIVMLLARLTIIIASLAIAGLLARKNITPPSAGTFSTNSILFLILLITVVTIEGTLVFFPALSLGPITEHFLMLQGHSF